MLLGRSVMEAPDELDEPVNAEVGLPDTPLTGQRFDPRTVMLKGSCCDTPVREYRRERVYLVAGSGTGCSRGPFAILPLLQCIIVSPPSVRGRSACGGFPRPNMRWKPS